MIAEDMSSDSPARKCVKMDNTAIPEDDLETNHLLETLMMESSSFTKTRGCQSGNYQDSDIFCSRDSLDNVALPATLDLTQRRSNVPLTRKLSAKKKVNQIFRLLSKELSRIRRSRTTAIPENIVANIVDSLGVQDNKVPGNDLYLVCKIDRESLDLDALRKVGLSSQNIFDETGRVVDVGCTGSIKPYLLMNKPPPKQQRNPNFTSVFPPANLIKQNGSTDKADLKDSSLLPGLCNTEAIKFGSLTRLSRKTEVIVNNHRGLHHYVPSVSTNGAPKFYKFFPDKTEKIDGSSLNGFSISSKAPPLFIPKNSGSHLRLHQISDDKIPTSSMSGKIATSSDSPHTSAALSHTHKMATEFKSSSALVADKLISNCS